ncbi:glycosyltransferase [Bacteriovorax sp. Seq25_V]|uniref:glycosyltransferase n=1 Tax=Bacteriovorax sp. Seq25_V TaxID=1201288 RepID=UPI00038A4F8E|nr:glycosyltransferase [Bacteriovorax sp. Seq25_V]EQC43368.1 glycosyltransferase, group 1 family protein [Bacteriovorax sp. Seq25_V]
MKRADHILILPSWYPTKKYPNNGIFTYNQAKALAQHNPNQTFYILNWGQEELYSSLKNPYKIVINLIRMFKSKSSERNILDNLIEISIPTITFSHKVPLLWIPLYLTVKKVLKKFSNIDFIHCHVVYPAGYIASKFSIPYIITEHMSPFPFPTYLDTTSKLQSHILDTYSSAVTNIAVSNSLKNDMLKYSVPNVQVIPNIVDESSFTLKNQNNKKEKIKLLSIGGLNHQKGFDILLEAFSKMSSEEQSDFHLTIIGTGTEESHLKSLHHTHAPDLFINWIGYIENSELNSFFHNCDFFILTSRSETFGIVYLEALYTGTPVIATKCGGPEEFIDDSNGFLVDNLSSEQVYTVLKNLKNNINNFNSKKIRENAMNEFSAHSISKKISNLYII